MVELALLNARITFVIAGDNVLYSNLFSMSYESLAAIQYFCTRKGVGVSVGVRGKVVGARRSGYTIRFRVLSLPFNVSL